MDQQNDSEITKTTKANLVDKIMAYEDGDMETLEEVTEFFQYLVDTGAAWQLQGSYGRMARYLIDQGLVTEERR